MARILVSRDEKSGIFQEELISGRQQTLEAIHKMAVLSFLGYIRNRLRIKRNKAVTGDG